MYNQIYTNITKINNSDNDIIMDGLGSLSLCDDQMILDNDKLQHYFMLIMESNDQSFLNVRVDFTRNYSISIIVIPIFFQYSFSLVLYSILKILLII